MLRVLCLLTWIFSLHAYFIIFVAFLLAKKNVLVKLSGTVSGLATLWVFSSIAMRLGVLPGLDFWFKLSVVSISMIPYAIYLLVLNISGESLKSKSALLLMALSVSMALLSLTDFYYDYSFVYYPESWLFHMNIPDLYEVSITPKLGALYILLGESTIILLCIRKVLCNRNLRYRRLFLAASFLYWVSGILSFAIPTVFPFELLGGLINIIVLLFMLKDKHALTMQLFIKPQLFPVFSFIMIGIFCIILNMRGWGTAEFFRPAVIWTMSATAIMVTAMTLFYEHLYTRFFTDRGNYLLRCNSQYHDELMSKLGDIDGISKGFLDIIKLSFGEGDIALYVYDEDLKAYELKNPDKYDSPYFEVGSDIVRKISSFSGIANATNVLDMLSPSSLLYKEIGEGHIRWITPFKVNDALMGFFFGGGFNMHSVDDMDKQTIYSITKSTALALQESYMMHAAEAAALTDPMTGLSTRHVIKEVIGELLEEKRHFVAMLFSVDDLTIFNLVYNQSEGDELIHVFSSSMKTVADDGAYLARISGKNFMAVLECSMVEAIEFDERLRTSFRLANADNIRHSITFSTGALDVDPTVLTTTDEIMDDLNKALRVAKKNGKNQLKVYDECTLTDEINSNNEYRIKTVEAISKALDLKDHFTYSHSINVASYARALAEAAGLDPLDCETVYQAGLVHDIGKISIPDSILLNPGKLTSDEYETIKTHVDRSEEVIRSLPLGFRMLPIALSHHERWDGKGYPNGLSGEEIPIGGRCLSIADTFDAMTSRRVYKRALTIDEALEEILRCSGTQFDPDLGPLFVKLVRDGVITPTPAF